MLRPGVRKLAVAAALAASSAILACDSIVEPAPCIAPQVLRSQAWHNPQNVLSVRVITHLRGSDSAVVRYARAGSEAERETPAVVSGTDSTVNPVFGLHAESDYNVRVVSFNDCGSTTGPTLAFSTGRLPADLPKYSAVGPSATEGFTVLAAGSYGLVIDNIGRVVWYHRFLNGPGLNFQAQPNGRYAARPNLLSPGSNPVWVEVDPGGDTTRTLGCALSRQPRVHDLLAQPDGSYWILCDEIRTLDLSATGGAREALVLGTGVQHISSTGELLLEWSPFDHIELDFRNVDRSDVSGGVINWTHGNALDLDVDGNLLVSFRNLSEIMKINTRTGAVMWRMGGAQNQFTFSNVPGSPFLRQHGVRSAGAGQIVLLDNLGDPRATHAERYSYDETARTATQIASYASSARVIAQLGGTTQNLSGGTLVSFGNGGSVEEMDAAGNLVWKIEGNPGYVFRAQRIRSLYRPGVGDSR